MRCAGRAGIGRPLRLALASLLLVAWGCGGSPQIPEIPWTPPADVERGPYLQAVTDSSAVVRWRGTEPPPRPSFRYRIVRDRAGEADTSWTAARVEMRRDAGREARLKGLPAGTSVVYEVVENGRVLGPYRFRTAPPPERPDSVVRVLAFGDSGWGSREQVTLARRMTGRDRDLALHVGDLAYPSGSARSLTLRHFDVYRKLLAEVPLFPVPGNHDLRTDGGRPYDVAFTWPRDGDGSRKRRYYRFRWGHALFVALDTSTPAQLDSLQRGEGAQYRWLRTHLRRAGSDSSVRWTVVYMHHPLYSSAGGLSGHGSNRALRDALRPLFEREGVDLVLAGHDHHYERTRPLLNGEPVPPGCGPVYVVTGGGGASRHARTVRESGRTAASSRRYHFLELSLRRNGAQGRAVGLDGRPLDRFRLRTHESAARPGSCAG